MKKIKYRNIAFLDAQNLTREKAEGIESISDCAAVLTTEAGSQFLRGIPMADVAAVLTVPDGTRLMKINGSVVLEGSAFTDGSIYLLVNGQMTVAPGVRGEDIKASVIGGKINGNLLCTDLQCAAFQSVGIKVNGSIHTYPHACRLRQGGDPLTAAEANLLDAGEKLYLAHKVPLEKGCAHLLSDKGITLYGESGLFAAGEDAVPVGAIWKGDPSKITWVPVGFDLRQGDLRVTPRNARTMRGKLYLTGSLIIEAEVAPEHLSALERVWVRQEAWIPAHLADALLPKVQGEPGFTIYDGNLLIVDGDLRLERDFVSQWPKALSVINRGDITFSEDLTPDLLRDSLLLLRNEGMITMSRAQQGALMSVLEDQGHIEEPRKEEKLEPVAEDPDFIIISDVAYYTL